MKLLSQAILAALFIAALAACDSSTDNPGGGSTDGFLGDPDLLGMWERLDETTGQPVEGYEGFLELRYSASTSQVSVRFWGREAGQSCWRLETGALTGVTTTTISEDGETRRYSADRERLAFYDPGIAEPDVLYRRSTRSADSFTPVCS